MSAPDLSMHTISELSERDCYDRLQVTAFGRVALCWDALPIIFPIHFAMLGEHPVFRTDPGTKLMAASVGHVLCLEIDEIHPVLHTGWSVLVTGRADVLDESSDVAAAASLRLRPWTGRGSTYVKIDAAVVTGREIKLNGDGHGSWP